MEWRGGQDARESGSGGTEERGDAVMQEGEGGVVGAYPPHTHSPSPSPF